MSGEWAISRKNDIKQKEQLHWVEEGERRGKRNRGRPLRLRTGRRQQTPPAGLPAFKAVVGKKGRARMMRGQVS